MHLLRVVPSVAALLLLAAVSPAMEAAGRVKVLDDFEGPEILWSGTYRGAIADEYATHGRKAFRVIFEKGVQYPGVTAAKVDLEWSGFDTLRMDVMNPQPAPVMLMIRIDDDQSGEAYSSRYNGEFLVVNGQTHMEIPFSKIAAGNRPIDVSRLRQFTMFMSAPEADTVLYFDNIRVTAGVEPEESRGRDLATVTEPLEIKEARERAAAARSRLSALVDVARGRGIPTVEASIALVTAELGIDVRPELPWYANRKMELYEYVADSCAAAHDRLRAALAGRIELATVPPAYDASALGWEGPDLVEKETLQGVSRRPILLFSMLYHRSGPLTNYFAPANYFVHTNAFAGASRYNVESTPVYKAYKEFPDARRVWNGDEGWCGHIVRDSSSLGGGKEPVVICLESPHIRAAIEENARAAAAATKDGPGVTVNIMGGELSYICYCDRTLGMFREYLEGVHGSIDALNAAWGTEYASFGDVKAMPSAAQAGENRGRWYDWQAFNCKRFVDHAAWVKSVLRDAGSTLPVAAGAVSYSTRADFGRSGVDEEALVRLVDDVVLNEAGASTIATDLLRSFSEGTKPMLDFEYHGDIAGILPHFLHGNNAMAMWWWPTKPDTEFPQFNETALPYSWNIPLEDVAEAMKIGLDVRRLAPQIAAFPRQPAEMAILYSRASMLQTRPEFLAGSDTPYTMELKSVYNAMLGLDAPTRFVTSMQVEEGKLAGVKLLVAPAAEYVFDGVAEGVLAFAESGGAVVITPRSFLFDEYARPRGHLARLGIAVKSERAATFGAGEAKRDAFLQGMIRETTAEGVPREELVCGEESLLPEGTRLAGEGVFQALEVSGGAKVIARTASGEPGIVETALGKGVVYYLATPLVPESMNAFLDAAAARAGVERPVRFAVAGKRDWLVEGRSAPAGGGGLLFYIVNHADAPREVAVTLGDEGARVVDLRDPGRRVDASRIELGRGRTGIFAAVKERPR